MIKLGNQLWLQKNLETTRYANGDPIPNITDQTEWGNMTGPAYSYYNNDKAMGEVYGALYNWYVVADSRELISGWHVPSYDDFMELIDYLRGEEFAAGKIKETGYTHWLEPNIGATNESGFTALASGARSEDGFTALFYSGIMWSSTEFPIGGAGWNFGAHYNDARMDIRGNSSYDGIMLRLVKNK